MCEDKDVHHRLLEESYQYFIYIVSNYTRIFLRKKKAFYKKVVLESSKSKESSVLDFGDLGKRISLCVVKV